MRVYLIRHGTTSGQLEKRYVGSTDEPLTADAVAWVKKNRRRYPVPQQTVTSPMKRCVATSARLFPGIPTETKAGLRECSFGEFEYKNYQELTGNEAYQRWIDSGGELPFPGGESRQEFADRSCSALLKSVTEQLKKGRDSVAYVVHGGTIMAVMERFCSDKRSYFDWQVKNVQGFELEVIPEALEACGAKPDCVRVGKKNLQSGTQEPCDAAHAKQAVQDGEEVRFLRLVRSLPLAEEELPKSGIEDVYVVQKNKRLQCGYTTGSCATAASMAAASMLLGRKLCKEVQLTTPRGIKLLLETEFPKLEENAASCAVRKFGGDDPDATDGLLIFARAERVNCDSMPEKMAASGKDGSTEKKETGMITDGSSEEPQKKEAAQSMESGAIDSQTDGNEIPDAQRKDNLCAEVEIDGGKGVGRVTKPGLEQPVGAAAINRVPRQMIREGVQSVCAQYGYHGKIRIIISVQGGEEVGKRTFNPHLGIEGGISILGTSGIVVPMSEQALIESIRIEMRQKVKSGETYLLITPGNYGADFLKKEWAQADNAKRLAEGSEKEADDDREKISENTSEERDIVKFLSRMEYLRPEDSMKCSNYVGETLDMAVELGVKGILFVSHIGKFVKVSGGIMNTHSAHADCRAELMAAQAVRAGADLETAQQLLASNTTDEALEILQPTGLLKKTMEIMIGRIEKHLQKHCIGQLQTEVVLFSNQFGYLGRSKGADELLEKMEAERARLSGKNDRL